MIARHHLLQHQTDTELKLDLVDQLDMYRDPVPIPLYNISIFIRHGTLYLYVIWDAMVSLKFI